MKVSDTIKNPSKENGKEYDSVKKVDGNSIVTQMGGDENPEEELAVWEVRKNWKDHFIRSG